MHGLSNETYSKIKKVIDKYPEAKFRLFGSRARGDYKYNSDIDLAVTEEISPYTMTKIRMDFLDLNIIYTIDVVDIKNCKNEKLIDNVLKKGVDF